MSDSEPNLKVAVDLTNPGQFFGCCGLMELAARVKPNALGYFCDNDFIVNVQADDLFQQFFNCAIDVLNEETTAKESSEEGEDDDDDDANLNPYRHRTAPMRILKPFGLRLDWWKDDIAQSQKLKTWSAGQRVTDLLIGHKKKHKRKGKPPLIEEIPSMRSHMAISVQKTVDWLRVALPIAAPGAFSYDSRLSRNNALDLGHTDSGILSFSPAADVLTLVGLQRFRPLMIEQWTRNRYCTWREPLPVQIAPAVVLGFIPSLVDACFEFPIKPRDAKGRYKLFGHAQPARRSHG